jgi:hypothetical protein
MGTRRRRTLLVALATVAGVCLVVAVLGYLLLSVEDPDGGLLFAATHPEALAPLAACAEAAREVTAYEGLPHQIEERELLEQERRENPTLRLRGFDFYEGPLEVGDGAAGELSRWLGERDNFREWNGPYKCGGFHPDYAVEWKGGGGRVLVLICLGCCEIRAYRGLLGVRPVQLHMSQDACRRVGELLKPSRKH